MAVDVVEAIPVFLRDLIFLLHDGIAQPYSILEGQAAGTAVLVPAQVHAPADLIRFVIQTGTRQKSITEKIEAGTV
jgi:hypothetical protein